MENIIGNIGLIVAIFVVAIVIILQIVSFVKTKRKIAELGGLFDNVAKLHLKETSLPKNLKDKQALQQFLSKIPNRHEKTDDGEDKYENLSLIVIEGNTRENRLRTIINRTNEYLCKNTGTSADLGILESICDGQKESLEDEIRSSLNVPLYLGLAGTFIGIITGLIGIDFQEIFNSNTSDASELTGLQHLLYGVISAMVASLLGLIMTVWNSAISYKSAVVKSDEGKEYYMDFIRRELMPTLSTSMASSLNSLRGVLGHFVDKFGRNLDAYADSADLLNDNLEKQHLVLQEINNLSLTKTANKIAETFVQLKESSDALGVFQTYQKQLNATIGNMSGVVNQIQTLLNKFDEFSAGLSIVVNNQNTANELQRDFKEAIKTHFPTGGEARDIWRKEFDLFIEEGKRVSESLSSHLAASTEHIRNFVENNAEFFDTFNKMKDVLATMVQYTQVQAECYKDLKGEILSLRSDYKDAQYESIELHKATIKAVEEMTKVVKSINKG